ncbi:MAG: SusC/RagA family TonB-linked outer membrane protein, partial [Candidatus Saccharimonadales bacterium]
AIIELVAGKRYGSIYGYAPLKDSTGKQVYDPTGIPQHTASPVFLGNGEYNMIVGLRNTFTYKNFSFYFLIDGKFGAEIYSQTNYMAYEDGQSKATLPGREKGLDVSGVSSADGKPVNIHIRGYNDATTNTGIISIVDYYEELAHTTAVNMYNGDFIKLREVSLGYKFPNTFFNRVGISNITVSVVARNLLNLMDHIPNVDPESIFSTGNAQGLERLAFPVTREFGLKINLNF